MRKKINLNLLLFLILAAGLSFVLPAQAQSGYQAQRTAQSHVQIPKVNPGDSFTFWVNFKNTGSLPWEGYGPNKVILSAVAGINSEFKSNQWYEQDTPVVISPAFTIVPGDEIKLAFEIKAPQQPGIHWETFRLTTPTGSISGGEIEVAVKVTEVETALPSEESKEEIEEEEQEEEEEAEEEGEFWQSISPEINVQQQAGSEPQIRVGLLFVEEGEDAEYLPLRIKPLNSISYDIVDKDNFLLVRNTQGEETQINYDRAIDRYFINDEEGTRLIMTDSYLKLRPTSSQQEVFEISSWKNGPFWDYNGYDNEFIGEIEIQYNPSTERLWVINQLPLETYLQGIAEVGDDSPDQLLKAQIIAARTYAMFRIISPKYTNTPTGEPLFTLRATQADQVYRGYQRAQRSPHTVRAAEEIRGIIATYQGDPIMAYYFAQSDGTTRSSYQAGMSSGPVAYLQEKNDPPGQGKELLGHGVGMPQKSALVAAQQGANYAQILKYYYTGIELTKAY